MDRYIHWFLTQLEQKASLFLNQYLDGEMASISARSDSPNTHEVLPPFQRFHYFVQHLFKIQETSNTLKAELDHALSESLRRQPGHHGDDSDSDDDDPEEEEEKGWMVGKILEHKHQVETARIARFSQKKKSAKWKSREEDEEEEGGGPTSQVKGEGDLVHDVNEVKSEEEAREEELFRTQYLYMMDTLLYKIIVTLFKFMEFVALKDIKFQNVVLIENSFQFANTFENNLLDKAPFDTYFTRARLTFYQSVHQYMRWLITKEFRSAMFYFGRIEDMIRKGVATPYEIQFSHSQDDFVANVQEWLGEEQMKTALNSMASRLHRHIDDVHIIGIVWSQLREYFLHEYAKIARITEDCFPGHELPTLWHDDDYMNDMDSGAAKWCYGCKQLLHNGFRVSTILREREVDEDTVTHLLHMMSTESEAKKWYLHFPADIKDPFKTLKRIVIHADDDEDEFADVDMMAVGVTG